jgi:uncharacterized protein (TIGR00730 family)
MKSIAVFCGSKSGTNDLYEMHARQLGELMAAQGFKLIYGGGNKGLMGAVANAVMNNGGSAVGVIPERLAEWDHHHKALTELIVVGDMHTRKKKMYELADFAVILPGGFGTMDEMFEMLTWNQLAIHDKLIFILNTAGYYSDLFQMMQKMEMTGFLHQPLNKRVKVFDGPDPLIKAILQLKDLPQTPQTSPLSANTGI